MPGTPDLLFVIEDELHAEQFGRYLTREAAVAALATLAATPWDASPNAAPCAGWQTCGREYVLVAFDDTARPWREVSRTPALDISAAGTVDHLGLT